MNTWIITDTSYLVYRSQYGMRGNADPLFSFLATVVALRERFDSDKFVFCFDGGKLKRNDLLPTYKERPFITPEHEEQKREAKGLMKRLRLQILPELGFVNILGQKGYEADDVIASVVQNSLGEDEAVIVASDEDLFQLIRPNVIIYNPSKDKITNEEVFSKMYDGLRVDQWPMVKALAGCNSDNVPGIRGVGEKTAAQYLNGRLEKYSARWDKINNANKADIEFNLRLVKLPFEGTKTFELIEDEEVNWRRLQTYQPKAM